MEARKSPPAAKQAIIDRYLDKLAQLGEATPVASLMRLDDLAPATVATAPSIDINTEIAREQKLKNDNAEQDIELKRKTLNRLFVFLGAETAFIFLFAFCQGIAWPAHFHLEEWSFKLLVTVTIMQITGMLYVAVRYLFPKGK